jgi:hypothetical protein
LQALKVDSVIVVIANNAHAKSTYITLDMALIAKTPSMQRVTDRFICKASRLYKGSYRWPAIDQENEP